MRPLDRPPQPIQPSWTFSLAAKPRDTPGVPSVSTEAPSAEVLRKSRRERLRFMNCLLRGRRPGFKAHLNESPTAGIVRHRGGLSIGRARREEAFAA